MDDVGFYLMQTFGFLYDRYFKTRNEIYNDELNFSCDKLI